MEPKKTVMIMLRLMVSRKSMNWRILSKMIRPSSMAATMVEKESSFRIMSAASRATCVPRRPMATPISAFFRAGASFTPSPVMATILPCCCKRRSDPVSASVIPGQKRCCGENPSVCSLWRFAGLPSSLPFHGLRRFAIRHSEFFGDGAGGGYLVAGDHHRPDAGGMGGGYRFFDFLPGWIEQADQPEPGQPL